MRAAAPGAGRGDDGVLRRPGGHRPQSGRRPGPSGSTWWTWTAPSPAARKIWSPSGACARPSPSPWNWGAGIRTLDTIKAYLDLGLDRLILGTVVLKNPDLAARACADFPGKIAIGLDARDGLLAVEGWTETSRKSALEVAQALEPLNPAALIYTDISRDGVKRGVNIGATRALAEAVNLPVIASAGSAPWRTSKPCCPWRPWA